MIICVTEPQIDSIYESEKWFVYIVECRDKSLYTGITNNLEKRLNKHNSGKGAKYTRARKPVSLKYYEEVDSKSIALKREIAIKKLSKNQKIKLISNFYV